MIQMSNLGKGEMMPTPQDYQKALEMTGGNRRAAARILGVNESTIRRYLQYEELKDTRKSKVKKPSIPDKNLPVEKIIEQAEARFNRAHATEKALKWMRFEMPDDKPVAISFMGDPHVDDDGCNWPLLRRDVNIMANTKGMYGVNCGDLTNNWVGRLMALYAEQGMTRSESHKIIKWLLKDSGIDWLLINAGNHDAWNDGMYLLQEIIGDTSILTDWQAKFTLCFPNGCEVKIDLAHDHKGNSQWNDLHAQIKTAKMGDTAHIYAAGHRHTWATYQHEDAHKNIVYWCLRARGYKYIDDYGIKLGFGSQQYGATVTAVIDPKAKEDVNRIQCFADVQRASDYLKFMRG